MIKYLIVLTFFTAGSLSFGNWFRLGSPTKDPLKIEFNTRYNPTKEYWSTATKSVLPVPDTAKNFGYQMDVILNFYLTRLLYVKFRVPYKYKRKVRFKNGVEDYTETGNFANYEFSISYTFYDSKNSNPNPIVKKAQWSITWTFDNGSDEDLELGASRGILLVRNKLKADIFFLPKKLKKLRKALYFSPEISFSHEGVIRSYAYEYSGNGVINGLSIDTTLKFYGILNKMFKAELYYKPYITFPEKNAAGVKRYGSHFWEHTVGTGIRWRPFGGRKALELGYKIEWQLHDVSYMITSKDKHVQEWKIVTAF